MAIIAHAHPQWCDPRLCTGDATGTEHRGTPTVRTVADHRVTISRVRYDETMPNGEHLVGGDRVRLAVEDQESYTPDGHVSAVEVDLHGLEVGIIATALLAVVDSLSVDYQLVTR